jgi:hypothetical protein
MEKQKASTWLFTWPVVRPRLGLMAGQAPRGAVTGVPGLSTDRPTISRSGQLRRPARPLNLREEELLVIQVDGCDFALQGVDVRQEFLDRASRSSSGESCLDLCESLCVSRSLFVTHTLASLHFSGLPRLREREWGACGGLRSGGDVTVARSSERCQAGARQLSFARADGGAHEGPPSRSAAQTGFSHPPRSSLVQCRGFYPK